MQLCASAADALTGMFCIPMTDNLILLRNNRGCYTGGIKMRNPVRTASGSVRIDFLFGSVHICRQISFPIPADQATARSLKAVPCAAQQVFRRQRLRTRFTSGVIKSIVVTFAHVCKHSEYDLSLCGGYCSTTEAQRFRNYKTVAAWQGKPAKVCFSATVTGSALVPLDSLSHMPSYILYRGHNLE